MKLSTAWGRGRFVKMLAVLVVACVINYVGDHLLGVQIELFRGLETFSFLWILDMFALPFLDGLVVGWLFGIGGKWLSYFPPLIVRSIRYFQIVHFTGVPQGATLQPLGWWGFFVILVMEAAAFGGILGEVMVKSHYGRSAPETVHKKFAADEGDS